MTTYHPLKGDTLTLREAYIYRLLIEGLTQQEIASKAFIELTTVKFHCRSIYTKLDVKGHVQLVVRHYQGLRSAA